MSFRRKPESRIFIDMNWTPVFTGVTTFFEIPLRKKFMECPSDAFGKKESLSKSADELVRLLLKLNSKIREKLNLSRKKKPATAQTDVVIIIMTNRKEKSRPEKPARPVETPSPQGDWLENLFAEIEGSSIKRRKSS
jgi:hypothetical protein